jgi:hypothetical protein
MQSMKSNLDSMDAEERALWESGQKGNWILACGMMQRSQVVLKDARACAAGVVRLPFQSSRRASEREVLMWRIVTPQEPQRKEKHWVYGCCGGEI